MPRQQINLEPHRDEIIALFQHGISSDSISRTLESRYNIQVKERTIQSRLRKWGIRKRSRTTTADEVLHARIKVLFIHDRLTDKAMLKLLRQDGYDISERTLRRLRFQLGLHARATLGQEQDSEPGSVPRTVPVTVSVPVLPGRVMDLDPEPPDPPFSCAEHLLMRSPKAGLLSQTAHTTLHQPPCAKPTSD